MRYASKAWQGGDSFSGWARKPSGVKSDQMDMRSGSRKLWLIKFILFFLICLERFCWWKKNKTLPVAAVYTRLVTSAKNAKVLAKKVFTRFRSSGLWPAEPQGTGSRSYRGELVLFQDSLSFVGRELEQHDQDLGHCLQQQAHVKCSGRKHPHKNKIKNTH